MTFETVTVLTMKVSWACTLLPVYMYHVFNDSGLYFCQLCSLMMFTPACTYLYMNGIHVNDVTLQCTMDTIEEHDLSQGTSLVPEVKKEGLAGVKYEVHYDPISLPTTVSEDKMTCSILSILQFCMILD